MVKIAQVQTGEYRPVYFYEFTDGTYQRGDIVILEVDRGSEFGRIVSDVERDFQGKKESPKGKIIRKATEGDLKQIANNRMKAVDGLSACLRKIDERKLDMKVVKSEYTFDSSKIVFFFTSDGRVDFRSLVKDLARVFRVRIELKQIGVRDRAKIVKGHGLCGREFCCSSYINGFHPLSIRMVKEQGLPLTPSRTLGNCGRIKCCMAYEFQVYRELSRGLPRLGDRVETAQAKGRVVDVNILKRVVHVDVGEGMIVKVEYPKRAGKDRKDEPLEPLLPGPEDDARETKELRRLEGKE
ncbi:MAG: stage 0 sporulation protein [Candidatus Omnitrophica bacterium]|nr:stage 0 sporulation protein [Candidatus Omnitrophota bacterium]